MESKNSTKAMICLKIAWMYRLLMDEANEKNYINQAFYLELLLIYLHLALML
ncbi:MAG: DUF2225 domain-containing protein [Peptostreptococcaceae bacterium]|nr:DUF2225 domain-containing protein [Peptostreptococcaceae bacterium]